MNTRDRQLHRHMKKRKQMAVQLPLHAQVAWAKKCIEQAALQQRTLFYILSSMWLWDIEKS